MFAKVLSVFALLGLVAAHTDDKPFAGVDPNTLQCDPKGEIFLLLPHFTDCTKFYMCAHGNEVLFSCSGATIFDFELQGCNWPADAKCILRDPKDDGSGDDIEGSGDDGSGDGSGFWQPKESDTYEIEEDSPASNAVLAAKFASILDCRRPDSAAKQAPYKGDCQRYWRCAGGILQAAYCSDGLFFNALTQQCDFEGNAKCETVSFENELEGEYIVYK